MLELLVACVLMTAVLAVCLQIVSAAASQRQAAAHRLAAVEEASNLMERLSARPWSELTPEAAKSMRLSPEAQAALPQGALSVEITQSPNDAGAKRISVEIRWQEPGGEPARPVRLVAWRYSIPAHAPREAP